MNDLNDEDATKIAVRKYFGDSDNWNYKPLPGTLVYVPGAEMVPLGGIFQVLSTSGIPSRSFPDSLRREFYLQGIPTDKNPTDGMVRITENNWKEAVPHAHWTPENFVAAMDQHYQFGHENPFKHPGRIPSLDCKVQIDDRPFPLGPLIQRMAYHGMEISLFTRAMQESCQTYLLPLVERGGRITIDHMKYIQQHCDEEYIEKNVIRSPKWLLEDLRRNKHFMIHDGLNNQAEVRLRTSSPHAPFPDFPLERRCDIPPGDPTLEHYKKFIDLRKQPMPADIKVRLLASAEKVVRSSAINVMTRIATEKAPETLDVESKNIIIKHRTAAESDYKNKREDFERLYSYYAQRAQSELGIDSRSSAAAFIRTSIPQNSPGTATGNERSRSTEPSRGPTDRSESRSRSRGRG
jgi:hypothetical protein